MAKRSLKTTAAPFYFRGMPERAFSMLELLVVLAIFAIMARFAWPELKALQASFERRNALASFEFDLRRARSEAMSRGTRVIMTLASNGTSYTLGEDRLPYDTGSAIPDTIIYTTNLPSGISISLSSGNKIIFNSHGFLSDESGIPRTLTRTVTLTSEGGTFAVATVYPVGVARFN